MDAMNELPDDLARALDTLDARAERAAAQVDSGRVAHEVVRQLRAPALTVPRPLWQLRTVRVAAAVVLFAAVGVSVRLTVPGRGGAERSALPVGAQTELLDASQSEAVLRAVEEARAEDGAAAGASVVLVDDLNEQELQALLQGMEPSKGTI